MHEPSGGIAEEVERQLQLALAAAAIAARRACTVRQHAIEQAQAQSAASAQAVRAQIEAERRLAAAYVEPVLDPEWWETAGPQEVTDMWQQADSWREPDAPESTPTIFEHAAGRIAQEVRERSGLDVTQILTLAAVQNLEREHQATLSEPVGQPADAHGSGADLASSRRFDDPDRREQLRARLVTAGVPDAAIDARTLADVGQARDAAEAARMPVTATPEPRPRAGRSAGRELRRQR